ncbi:MAG: cell division protein FtsZ, partial [Pseudomonadota bacterium]
MTGAGLGELSPRIVVLGVGGAGGNAVDNMIASELRGVEFMVANTDAQALARSSASTTIQLGPETTKGLGAGARPEVGAAAAEESADTVRQHLEGANMVFIAAGMGGGTGTGAAPIIARIAREMGALTVGVVTKPFGFEHARRMSIAEVGVEEIRSCVDT